MNIRITASAVAICALLMGASGCGKQEEAVPVTAPQARDTATGAVQKAVAAAPAQAEAAKQVVQATPTNLQAQAAGATNSVQSIIEQARKLIAENKPSDALALLNGLSGQQLSPDQQSLVQSLKEQIQKAVEGAAKAKASGEANKAVGGLLQPQK